MMTAILVLLALGIAVGVVAWLSVLGSIMQLKQQNAGSLDALLDKLALLVMALEEFKEATRILTISANGNELVTDKLTQAMRELAVEVASAKKTESSASSTTPRKAKPQTADVH